MIPPLTEAQDALLSALLMSNTDNRALQIIEAAFAIRNSWSPRSVGSLKDARHQLFAVIDEVAG
jgi:hypothetical protein